MTTKLTPLQLTAMRRLGANGYSASISTVTLKSLERRGLIEQTGDWYHAVTEAGIAVIRESERKESR